MKPVSEKTQVIILTINILILIALCIAIYVNGHKLSCDNCVIEFETNKRTIGPRDATTTSIPIKLMDLYTNFTEGKCYIIFDDNNGFRENK